MADLIHTPIYTFSPLIHTALLKHDILELNKLKFPLKYCQKSWSRWLGAFLFGEPEAEHCREANLKAQHTKHQNLHLWGTWRSSNTTKCITKQAVTHLTGNVSFGVTFACSYPVIFSSLLPASQVNANQTGCDHGHGNTAAVNPIGHLEARSCRNLSACIYHHRL